MNGNFRTKNKITEMKNSMDKPKSRMEGTEKKKRVNRRWIIVITQF